MSSRKRNGNLARRVVAEGENVREGGGRRVRYLRVAAASAIVAAAVVAVAVWLTPPEDAVSRSSPHPGLPAAAPQPAVSFSATPAAATAEEMEQEVIATAEALQAHFPDLPEALHVAAGVYADLRQTGRAEEIWRRCLALAPTRLAPRVGLAITLLERGDDEAAMEILESALAEGQSSPELYYYLAAALTKRGRAEEAEEVLRKGLAEYETIADNWRLLGQTQLQLDRFAEAEESLLRALDLGRESWELFFALATVSARLGKDDEAAYYRERFRELRAVLPEEADRPYQEAYEAAMRRNVVDSLSKAGAVFARQGDVAEAERLLLRAADLDPENAPILRELARMYLGLDRPADAWAVHRRLVELDPPNFIDCINLAKVAEDLGDLETVESAFQQAMDLRPDVALPYLGLAQLHLRKGRFERARWFAEGAVRREPSLHAYAALAAACQQLGDADAADAAREAARTLAARQMPLDRIDSPSAPPRR